MKEEKNIIFCVLTYKNSKDLEEFLKSSKKINEENIKVVVVNSFFDEITSKKIQNISKKYSCDFLEVENKGYGFGNNRGVEYINKKYKYKYLIISNPDIEILEFDINDLIQKKNEEIIIAPKIINKKNRNQNPMNRKYSFFSEYLIYKSYLKNNKSYCILGILLTKIFRFLGIIKSYFKKEDLIYCCHGSFIIFTKAAVDKLSIIFDEKIFLYGEEGDLAQNCRKKHIKIIYNSNIKVLHKEDGSVGISNLNLNKVMKKSQLYYYKKWYLDKR